MLRMLVFAVAIVAAVPSRAAQRQFVASWGSDANPCSLALPCRQFAAAATAVNPGGEIVVLDSAAYGPVTITKSVAIVAPKGVYAGISVFTGAGVLIDATNVVVVLRGLTINGQGGGANGVIAQQSGIELTVSDCELSNVDYALWVKTGGGSLTLRDSVLRKTSQGVLFSLLSAPVRATIDGVRVEDTSGSAAVALVGPGRVTVSNSVFAGGPSSYAGVIAEANTAGQVADVFVTRTVITDFGYGIASNAYPGAIARVVSDGNAINNVLHTAFDFYGNGGTELIYTPANNTVGYNNGIVQGGSLTTCCVF